jgi:hypothetical protein
LPQYLGYLLVNQAFLSRYKNKENTHGKRSLAARAFFKRIAQRANSGFDLSRERNQVTGQIESFDQFVVLLKNSVNQMIYKHAISTVVPARPVRLHLADETDEERF